MKKRGNKTRKGRRQNTKKRRVHGKQRNSRKMVGGVNFLKKILRRKDPIIYPELVVVPTNIILNEDTIHEEEMRNLNIPYSNIRKSHSRKNSNLKQIDQDRGNTFQNGPFVPFGYDPNEDPDGSRLAKINEELDKNFNDKFAKMQDDPSYKGDNNYFPKKVTISSRQVPSLLESSFYPNPLKPENINRNRNENITRFTSKGLRSPLEDNTQDFLPVNINKHEKYVDDELRAPIELPENKGGSKKRSRRRRRR